MTNPALQSCLAHAIHFERLLEISGSRMFEPLSAYRIHAHNEFALLTSDVDDEVVTTIFDQSRMEGTDNSIFVGYRARVRKFGGITISGNNNTIFIGPNANLAQVLININGSNNIIYIGGMTTIGSGEFQIRDNGGTIIVGDHCMFAARIAIGSSGPCTTYDRLSGDRKSAQSRTTVGDHVWLGRDVRIRPGAAVGSDSIVGQMSIVSGIFNSNSILNGQPASLIRGGVNWDRRMSDTLEQAYATNHYKQLHLKIVAQYDEHIASLFEIH